MFERCPNRHLLSLVAREWELMDTTRRSAFSLVPERAIGSVGEHEQLLQLIESGQPGDEIEAFARRHRMMTARYVLQHLGSELNDNQDASEPAS